jgi:OmcA/MtrC family decaheme c-type cytochrome
MHASPGASFVLLLSALLGACSGSTGPAGPAGATGATGPAGPQGSGAGVAALDVTTATAITGTVTGVAISGPPVVQFKLADENGVPLKGLPAADLGWVIAQLVPGENGLSSQWNSYIYTTVTPSGCPDGVAACDTAPKTQATVESATSGTLVDNGNGTYQYTFKTNITNVPNVTYNATLTHRVAFEIRGLAQANNASYTFQPSTGATTGIFQDEIVETATCDNCHTMLSAHGGARVEVQYCVMCHNPGTTDPYSGNALDMKIMIHKIHTGNTLPSIQTPSGPDATPALGSGYWIIGYMKSLNNFNTVLYPQDTRNCTTCHAQVPAATQAAEYYTVPSAEACGACHDNVNFATGLNHSAANIVANDTQCSTCHGPTSTLDNGQLQVIAAHTIAANVEAAKFQYIVNNVTFQTTGGNIYPVVKFSVVDPTNANAPYNILAAAPFAGTDPSTGMLVCAEGTARLAIDIAWDTSDYTNWGSGATASQWGQPVSLNPLSGCGTATPAPGLTGPDATGAFTMVSSIPLPTPPAADCPPASGTACPVIANVGVVIEGHPGVVLTTGAAATAIPVTSAIGYGNVAGGAPVARRTVVTIAQCDVCHNLLALHGSNRNDNAQVCVACHNPASTDVSRRIALTTATTPGIDGLWEQSLDFKFMIHAIHDGSVRGAAGSPFVVYGYGGSINNFSDVVYPGQINRCDACHQGTSYYPVSDGAVQATTFFTGLSAEVPNPTTPGNPISTSANMSVCSACHFDTLTQTHMEQNGGSTTVLKDAEGRTIPSSTPAGTETCAICHGSGGVADVRVVHNVPAAAAGN